MAARRSVELAERLLPHRTHSPCPLESEGHAENPHIDQHLSTEADPTYGSAATAISFILIALVERHGELVSKNELMAHVWPAAVVVEDNNVTVHVPALRRALGDGKGGNRLARSRADVYPERPDLATYVN